MAKLSIRGRSHNFQFYFFHFLHSNWYSLSFWGEPSSVAMVQLVKDIRHFDHADLVKSLNHDPLFLPQDFLHEKVLTSIRTSTMAIFTFYFIALSLIAVLYPKISPKHQRRAAYQTTNFLVNAILAFTGFYCEYWLLPQDVSVQESVQGFQNFYFLCAFQFSYQLWAIPVGIFLVDETTQMILHHIAVVFVSFMTCFLTNGFRYWTPFFFGMLEASSLPLAFMNMMKDSPDLIQKYPHTYFAVRLTFALSFLMVRIIMFLPRKLVFLRDHFLLFSSSGNLWYQIYMSIVFVSSAFLMLLQIFWARLIVQGLVRKFVLKKKVH